MFNITNLKGEKLEVILKIAWDRVIRERTPFQKYFIEEYFKKSSINSMSISDGQRELMWELEDLETEKFYSLLGFKKGQFIRGKNGCIYYVYGYFSDMNNYSNIHNVAVCLIKVKEGFCKEKVRFGHTFNVYFDVLGRTLYGTSEENYTDFYTNLN